MIYTKLGNSGAAVSKIALGTMYFGDETPQNEAFAILDTFVEAGGNHVDTADVYAGNESEKVIGRWLAARPRDVADRVFLATKGRTTNGPAVNDTGLSRRHLHRALDASLRRLGVETIDLYQLHASDLLTPMDETIAFLGDAMRAGKIHYIGLSNFTGWELQLFVSTAKAMGVQPPVSLQPQYSLLSREIEWEIVPAAIHNGLGLLPWSPLAGGFQTGNYRRGEAPAAYTRAGSKKGLYQRTSEEYAGTDRNWATIDAVVRIAQKIGKTPSQIALSWIANRRGVTAPIVGARTAEHLAENLGALDVVLDEADAAELETLSAPVTTNGYPYGEFGVGQRARYLQNKAEAPPQPYGGGSEHPTGT